MSQLSELLQPAFESRASLVDARHECAFRLFNGFREGLPTLVLDVLASTLVVHDYAESPEGAPEVARQAADIALTRLPWLEVVVWKVRNASTPPLRNGTLLHGEAGRLARRTKEHGVTYALAPTLNRDTSFYPDTRNLRAWAVKNLSGARVLNTFAYTGSLGVAAQAGGADQVVHTDLNRRFLTVAKDSTAMNGWPVVKANFRSGDFFDVIGALKRADELFDCVFVDPPFLSVTPQGRVDLQQDLTRLLNKVRPLVADGGALVVINNALFVSGADFHSELTRLCADGFLRIESVIPVPEDCCGDASTSRGAPPVDPAPFNHPTKIAVLRARRRDGRGSGPTRTTDPHARG